MDLESAREFEIFKRELLLAPRQVKVRLLERIEEFLKEVSPDKTYPFDYIVFRVTGRRPEEPSGFLMTASEVEVTLSKVLEEVGQAVTVYAESIDEPICTIDELAARWEVSPITVMRWRRAGLPGRLFRFGRSRRKIGVRQSLAAKFETERARLIRLARVRRRLSDEERIAVTEEALVSLAREEQPGLILMRLADTYCIRQSLLERFFASAARENPSLAALTRAGISQRDSEAIYRKIAGGASVESVAGEYGRTAENTRRIYARGRLRRLLRRPIKVVVAEEFSDSGAHDRIMKCEVEDAAGAHDAGHPEEAAVYLEGISSLPLLSRAEEVALFRKYNYLKYMARELRSRLDARRPDHAAMDEVDELLKEAERVRDHIVRSNLRLVMAIAKRHFGRKTSFPALVSDGNMALLDAVETFDYSRGNRFSTYAGWAIVRRFARTVPEENYRIACVDQEILDVTARVEIDFTALKPAAIVNGIAKALSRLPERERVILENRFGLGRKGRAHTLAEVGALLGVTKERIRQIEIQALKHLKKIVEATSPELVPE